MYTGPSRIAHRGNVRRAPANTLEAVAAAYDCGCEGAEIDVRVTADKKAILAHDSTVEQMVKGGPSAHLQWRYRDHSWADLSDLVIPYRCHLLPELPREGIGEKELNRMVREMDPDPTHAAEENRTTRHVLLDEILRWTRQRSRHFFLEIECKEPQVVEPVREALERIGGTGADIVFSGNDATIDQLVESFASDKGGAPATIGANIRTLTDEWKNKLESFPLGAVDLNPDLSSTADVEFLKSRGLTVLANLGDRPSIWQHIHECGFDGFKTNYPEEYSAWWFERYA